MSVGRNLLSAIVRDGSRTAFRQTSEDLFTEEELPLYQFVSTHYRRHGQLPNLETLEENGYNLNHVEQPISYYAERARDRAIYTQIQSEHSGLIDSLRAREMSEAVAAVRRMAAGVGHFANDSDVVTLSEAVQDVLEDYQLTKQTPGLRGVPFGWESLDELTGGAQPGDVISVVGRPGMGKSYSMIYMALSAWMQGHPVILVTMEMTILQTARRALGMMCSINPDHIRRGQLSMWGEDIMHDYVSGIDGRPPFRLVAGSFKKSVADVDALVQEFTPEAVYVDASYLMHSTGQRGRQSNRFETIAEVGQELKELALNRNIPVVHSVQFNRSAAKGAKTGLDQIYGSDVIGQISSVILGLGEGESPYETTTRKYSILKNRDGESDGHFTTKYEFEPFDMTELPAGATTPGDEESTGWEI